MESVEPLAERADMTLFVALADQARTYIDHAQATNTRRAYRSDWAHFMDWCAGLGVSALPATAETVALYITALSNIVKPATIQRRISSISQAHQTAGLETPTAAAIVQKVWAGIRRVKGCAQNGKAALLTSDICKLLSAADNERHLLMALRDRALLLIGFAGAFRRSELVAVSGNDIEYVSQGVVVHVRRSKTDQDGHGLKKAIPFGRDASTCPVHALKKWIETAGIIDGPVFRRIDRHGNIGTNALSDQAVSLIVKKLAVAAGLDPAHYAGHSLRSGHATQAAAAGTPDRIIMKQTGHRSLAMVQRYIRDGELFKENAASSLGL